MAQSPDIYVAKESFATDVDGVPVIIKAGITRVRKGHSLLKKHALFFEPLTIQFDVESSSKPHVEQATAAPNEQRGRPTLSRPAPAAQSATETEDTPANASTDDATSSSTSDAT